MSTPTAAELVFTGKAALWTAPAATAATAFATTGLVSTPATPWVEVGYLEAGVVLNFDRKTVKVRVDTESNPVGVTSTTTTVTLDVTLSEDTVASMALAYGGGTVVKVTPTAELAGTTTLTLSDTLALLAVMLIGANAYGLDRQLYIPRLVSAGKVKTTYQRAKTPRTYPATFTAICPMATITIIDATAAAT